ncbi:hypothetical protein D9619_000229 [Psilocybe cf. subviscida]|uniref:Uncharacterized protein n=1 Tax=Psilocybe cf. subviscida TaxID=2480587 RepID=A0A8H5F2P7_9AGAR|nr:hypothetical protein D9619_000229 [Psilocybe cf. subviscida]
MIDTYYAGVHNAPQLTPCLDILEGPNDRLAAPPASLTSGVGIDWQQPQQPSDPEGACPVGHTGLTVRQTARQGVGVGVALVFVVVVGIGWQHPQQPSLPPASCPEGHTGFSVRH